MKLAGPFLARLLRATAREIEATLPRVRASADEEALHDMRVAVRRMRVLLKIARPIWLRVQVEAIRAGFTHIHRETSALRDEEVFRETLTGAPLESDTFVRFRRVRARREAELRALAHRHLRHGALRRPLDKLNALLALPGAKPLPLDRFALRVHERLHARVVAHMEASVEDAVALHELRIACKNLRYASELLGPALPPERAATEKPAARFQKHLGEVHDLDVASDIVRRSRALTATDSETLLAWLSARRKRRIETYLDDRARLVLIDSPAEPSAIKDPSRAGVGRSR